MNAFLPNAGLKAMSRGYRSYTDARLGVLALRAINAASHADPTSTASWMPRANGIPEYSRKTLASSIPDASGSAIVNQERSGRRRTSSQPGV